jgi:acetoacetyl-CoA synthetase
MQPGCSLNDEIIQRIKTEIRTNTTPRHVPAKILEGDDIPRTMSGKLVELAVREVIHNRVVKNKEAIANPEALELFRNLEALTL